MIKFDRNISKKETGNNKNKKEYKAIKTNFALQEMLKMPLQGFFGSPNRIDLMTKINRKAPQLNTKQKEFIKSSI
jgi:hypothetical protein